MKKNFLIYLVLLLLFIPVFIFTGCSSSGDDKEKVVNGKVNLASKRISVEEISDQYYTGEPIKVHSSNIRIHIDDEESYLNPAQLNITYANNVEVGVADMIITAKEESRYVYGTITIHFNIVPNYKQGQATTFEEVKFMLSGNYYKYVRVTENIEIPRGETLVIPAEKSLTFVNSWAEYKNYGTIIISENARMSIGNGAENWFLNEGTITNNGELTLVGRCYVSDGGTITGKIKANENSKIYTNSQVTLTEDSQGQVFVRTNLSDPSVNVQLEVDSNNSCRYENGIGGKPDFIVEGVKVNRINEDFENALLRPTYANSNALGTATATLTANWKNTEYFGQITKEYEIIKGKVDCNNEQELIDFQNSGLYDEYILKYGVSLRQTFTLQEWETLWVDQTAFYGIFNNYGTIKPVQNCTISIEGEGVFNNFGSIIPTDTATISCGFSGIFNNGSEQKTALLELINLTIYDFPSVEYFGHFNNYSIARISGSLKVGQDSNHIQCVVTNYGEIIATGNQSSYYTTNAIYGYGTICNYGDIDNFKFNLYATGNFENFAGATVVTTNTDLFNGSILINNAGATFTFGKSNTDKTNIERINIVNAGEIINKSIMDVKDAYILFDNTGTFDNSDGQVWAFSYMQDKNINENLTIIKRLSQSEITLKGTTGGEFVQDLHYTYDGTTKCKPVAFQVDGITLNSSDYHIEDYAYRWGVKTNDKDFISAGEVEFKIRITNFHNNNGGITYGGQVTCSYFIDYGLTTADSSNFVSVLNNKNWGTIQLEEDVTYNGYNIVIQPHQTVDTNGNSLTIITRYDSYSDYYYTFINEGKIIVRQVGNGDIDLSNCGFIVEGVQNHDSVFINKGEIENHGIIYANENGGRVQSTYFSSVTGDGKIYTWPGGVFNNTGDNTIYARIALAAGNIELSQDVFDYNFGDEIKPTVNAIKDDSYNALLSDYTVTYKDNIYAGTAKVIVTPNNRFDEHFISGGKTFTIKRIAGILNSTTIYDLDGINYYKYTLTSNLTLYDNVTFPDDVIFDYGDYRITTGNYRITIGGADTQIWVNINSGNVSNFNSVRSFADKITITSDITLSSTTNLYLYYSGNYNDSDYLHQHADSLTIDLNGHTINGLLNTHFTSNHDMYLNIIDSSPSHSGVIRNTNHPIKYVYQDGSAKEYYSLSLSDSSYSGVNIYINLENITVYGMAVYEINDANRMQITATNCKFYKPTTVISNYPYVRSVIHSYNDNATITMNDCTVEQ